MDRNRFRRLVLRHPGKPSWFAWMLWGVTSLLVLQFFIPLALNSYEYRFKPEEICGLCPSASGSNPSHEHTWCLCPPPNRTCPDCGHEWNAGDHEILSTPWILKGVAILLRWG